MRKYKYKFELPENFLENFPKNEWGLLPAFDRMMGKYIRSLARDLLSNYKKRKTPVAILIEKDSWATVSGDTVPKGNIYVVKSKMDKDYILEQVESSSSGRYEIDFEVLEYGVLPNSITKVCPVCQTWRNIGTNGAENIAERKVGCWTRDASGTRVDCWSGMFDELIDGVYDLDIV